MMSLSSVLGVLCALLLSSASAWIPSSTATTRNHAILRPTSALGMSDSDSQGTQNGTVKWFDTVKGFGFITPDDGSSDVFVHQTAIRMEGFRSLADGEAVEFRVEEDSNTGRRKAVDVTGPGGAEVQGAPFRPDQDSYSY